MNQWKSIADIRREYGRLSLSDESVPDSPITQFERWFSEVLQTEKSDPTAMVLSTVDAQGRPDSRVVLLKGLEKGSFVFYTNYTSVKAKQIEKSPYAALNFYWPQMARQVRVRGAVQQVSKAQSDAYFSSRPIGSQLSAVASPQSCKVKNRAELEARLNALITENQQRAIVRPDYWGGYQIVPEEFEFWQGRDNRLHDRIQYYLKDKQWMYHRLAP